MFSSTRAALRLLFSLLGMRQFFAGNLTGVQRSVAVFRGETAVLNCSKWAINTTQITWKKDTLVIFSFSNNMSFSNFSSQRQVIDKDCVTRLSILKAQADDAGLYSCILTSKKGLQVIEWNVTVTENPEKDSWSTRWYLWTTPAIGSSLCFIILSVCLYRKCKMGATNQDPVQGQFQPQSAEETDLTQPQRRHNKRRSDYIEQLNSIYDPI